MLQIEHLTITHKKDLTPILTDLNLVLNPGCKAAVIGEEGNGKSTLLKLLADPALISGYAEWEGTIHRGGPLGYLPQELPPEDREKTVYEFFAESPSFFDLTPKELADLGMPFGFSSGFFYSGQRLGTLSGGEKVKAQLARLLLEKPVTLLLDEPSNDLDLETVEWLEDFLRETPLAVLFISHDEMLLENTANMVVHLELLRKKTLPRASVAKLSYREYAAPRLRLRDHQAQVAQKERQEFRQKMERFRQIRNKVEHQQATISRQDPHGARLLKKKMHAVQSMGRRFEREKENMTPIPESEEAIFLAFSREVSIPNGKTVLDLDLPCLEIQGRTLAKNIRLHVEGPQKTAIVGRNGSGKTTLLRQIARELLARTDIKAAYMPQNYEELLPMEQTPVEFLNPGGSLAEETKIRGFLGSLRYTTAEMSHAIGALSGGQKAKLLLLKMILEGSNVLILDEPTRNFSPLSGPVIRDILGSFGGAILAVSHDRLFLEEVCTQVYGLTTEGLLPVW